MPNVNKFPSSKLKLDEFFLNWLSSQDSQKLVRPRGKWEVAVPPSSPFSRSCRSRTKRGPTKSDDFDSRGRPSRRSFRPHKGRSESAPRPRKA